MRGTTSVKHVTGDYGTTSFVAAPSILEASTGVDSGLGNYVNYSSLTDTANASALEGALSIVNGVTSELSFLNDAVASNMLAVSSVLEALSLIDSALSKATMVAVTTEPVVTSEVTSRFVSAVRNLMETVASLTSEAATNLAVASSTEQVSGTEVSGNITNMVADAKEKATLQSATYLLADILKRTAKDNTFTFGNAAHTITLTGTETGPVFTSTEVLTDFKGD